MDVDLLRPGTVPISPETVLWFEFLLDKSLLFKHLHKPNPDPSPVDLILKFNSAIYDSLKNEVKHPLIENAESGDINLNIANEPDSNSVMKPSSKVLALKILSLKIAAFIKWNLETLNELPLKVQLNLILDLLNFTSNDKDKVSLDVVKISSEDFIIKDLSDQHLFALVFYHRWVLATNINRLIHGNIRSNGDLLENEEENILFNEENLEKSLSFLRQVLESNKIPSFPTFDCFVPLTEASKAEPDFHWENVQLLDKNELCAQVFYDLANYYFHEQRYEAARVEFLNSARYLDVRFERKGFCIVDRDLLESFLVACGSPDCKQSNLSTQVTLATQENDFDKVLDILIEDTKIREIPLSERIVFELDLEAKVSNGTLNGVEAHFEKIVALNTVRCVVEKFVARSVSPVDDKFADIVWAASIVMGSLRNDERQSIRSFFLNLIISLKSGPLLNSILQDKALCDLVDFHDVEVLRKLVDDSVEVPDILKTPYWEVKIGKRNPKMEIQLLEQHLNASFDSKELRELLLKLTNKDPKKTNWRINVNSDLPIPLQNVLSAIPKGFLQDFSYILLSKSRTLFLAKDWTTSMDFLETLQEEIKSESSTTVVKLYKLISWEILLVQIAQLFEEWPYLQANDNQRRSSAMDRQELAKLCEKALKNNESGIIPRTEVMEQCVLCLLNLGRWDFLVALSKPWSFVEMASGIAAACQDVVKSKGNKKFSKEIWDLVISCFANSSSSGNQSKRNSSGSVIQRDSTSINNSKLQLIAIFSQLRDSTAFSVSISLLAKLYNLLRDDGSIEVNIEYCVLWPSTISNLSSFNTTSVIEALSNLVQQGLKFYPSNVSWLQLMGDLCFSNTKYENALKYFLQSLMVSTGYFNMAVRGQDHIFRRMIKCCTQLGCHTQAAVLCQFLEPPDYTLAFRSLVDFKSCNDSVEAYYHCFWDTSILEYLVHLHHKRGELQRKKKAIHTIGLLELNANNNEKIQREAINQRKTIFLHALCKQYLR